ncbi:MAG: DNA polymerase I [Fusobacterium sp.]|nr:DNA polymerase I [Fusobacterium sp.]
MKRAVLLDVSAIMYRAYFGNMNFRTKTEPTGAVYGFINTLLSIINEFNPDFMAAAFDVKRSSLKRSEIYTDYKAHRESAPEDLIKQIPRIEEVLDYFNVKRYKIEGYEADDVLGSLAKKISKENDTEVIIVTGDKDLAQLVDENITIALLGKGTEGRKFGILKTDEDVVNYLGVAPDKIPDLFGLIGDKSDGIPGVTKIGEKKALAMFEKYETLEKIYENIDKISEISGIGKGLVNNLKNEKEMAFLSRELAKIFTNLDIEAKQEDLTHFLDKKKFLDLCNILEFKMFIRKLDLENFDEATPQAPEKEKNIGEENFDKINLEKEKIENKNEVSYLNSNTKKNEQFSLFVEKKENPNLDLEKNIDEEEKQKINFKEENREFILVDNNESLEEEKKYFETYKGLASIYFEDAGIVMSTETKDLYFPLFYEGLLNRNIDKKLFKNFIENLDTKLISYDFKRILNLGFEIKNMVVDLMIAFHLISSKTKVDPTIPIVEYSKIKPKDYKTCFGKADAKTLSGTEYGNFLIDISQGLLCSYDEIIDLVYQKDLEKVLFELEMPLISVLSRMERKGIKVDENYFKSYSLELEMELAKIEKKIYEEAGETFNINSPKQLGEVLFVNMELPSGKKTKTGFSTDVTVLEDLEFAGYEIATLLLNYRKLNKLKNTYVDTIPKLIDRKDGRIHTTYNQIGTVTGRLSSLEPNLQNIPVKTDDGMRIREGFIADDKTVLVSIDYSQVELRVLTSLCKDKNLVEAYKENKDLHDLTARKIFSLDDDEEISREQRTIAKIINFSIIYGKTAFGLSKELKIPVKDANEYIKKYFEQYPSVTTFEREIIEFAEEHGYVQTLFGRKRFIPNINSHNKNIKSQAERMAVNTVIQGTAAEILKKVMLVVDNFVKDKDDIDLLLQVHDELIFEIKESSYEKYISELEEIMTKTVKLDDVNLKININMGKKWSDAK